MNDIESTIDYIKTNHEKLNIGIDYSNGKDHTAITLLDKQAELVIKALQEKAEREKGCEYCRNISKQLKGHKGFGYAVFFEQIAVDEIFEINIDVDFCPHCGRKLGENNG